MTVPLQRAIQLIVLTCPTLTVAVKGGANGSLMVAALLSLAMLFRQRLLSAGTNVGATNPLVKAYALAMAAPVFALIAVQVVHGGSLAVGPVSSAARFLLAVPLVIVLWRSGASLVRWADLSFALGGLASGLVMLMMPRNWSLDRWGSSFLDPINFGGLSILLAVLSLLSLDWRRRDPWQVRVLKVAGFVSGLCASIPTGARGPWLALLVLVVVLAFTTMRQRSPAMRIAIWASVTVVLLMTFASIDAFRGRFDLMAADLSSFIRGGERDTSPGIRLQIWRAALVEFARQPVLGLGSGGFAGAVENHVKLGLMTPLAAASARAEVHNSYLAYAVDFGIAGLLSIVSLFVVPAVAFLKRLGSGGAGGRAALLGLATVTLYASYAVTVDVFALKMMAAFYAAATAFMAAIAFARTQGDAPAPVVVPAGMAANRDQPPTC